MSLLSLQLQAFAQVAETKTVHGAAKRLGLTQTGVTQRIRSLEASLGVTLFTRSRMGMRPTHEGVALLRYCAAAQEIERDAMAVLQESATQSEVSVRVIGPTSIMRSRLIPAMSSALSQFRGLLLNFEISDTENLVERLKSGESHLAAVPRESVTNELESKLLKPEKYVLVGTKNWKNRTTAQIVKAERIIDFSPTDLTTHSYLKKFNLIGHARAGRHFVNNNESLCDLMVQGHGYGVLTEEFANPWLKDGRLIALNSGRTIENHLALAWYPRKQMPKYLARLIELAR